MVGKDFNKDFDKMIEDGLISKDKHGEIILTDKGRNHTEKLLEKKSSKEYMKQVAKHFGDNGMKKTINARDIADEIDMISNTKINIYDRYNIPQNDDLKNYQLFCKLMEYVRNDNEDKHKEMFEKVYQMLPNSKYFEMPDNINLLLQNTSNKAKKVKLPYLYTFIDASLVIGEKTYYCLHVEDNDQIKDMAIKYNKDIKNIPSGINIITFFESSEGIGYEKILLYQKEKDKDRNKIREYVLNFCDFVNSEDVRLVVRDRSEKNTSRRVAKGKMPIPAFNKINVVGYLSKYLNELESNEASTRFSHRFWIRGHFKRFWDKKRYKNIYDKFNNGETKGLKGRSYNMSDGVLRIWVYPYIKGDGILINKGYIAK